MKQSFTYILGLMLTAAIGSQTASALTVTQMGTLTSDSQVITYNFTLSSASPVNIYTTSYAGGTNLNGTISLAGGFVPDLTLFQANGSVITSDGADATARGMLSADPTTHLVNDASIATTLAAGSYTVTLSEFPNVAVGNLSNGFLLSSPTATGDTCGVSGGQFLEADIAPCVQRTGNYALDVSTNVVSSTPEPATLWMMIPALGVAYFWRKRSSTIS